jgi:hypothetical protein
MISVILVAEVCDDCGKELDFLNRSYVDPGLCVHCSAERSPRFPAGAA